VSIVQEESLRERKKTCGRQLMIESHGALIAANGLRSLKVRDVARGADCSIGSVYNEFGDSTPDPDRKSRDGSALTARLVAVPAEGDPSPAPRIGRGLPDVRGEHANLLPRCSKHRMEDDGPFPEDSC